MKKTIIILAHPDIENSKMNKGLLEEVKKHPEIKIHDIYKLYSNYNFNMPIPAKEEHDLLQQYERIVLQFPLFWYSSPPLLKKWIDDVLQDGLFPWLKEKELSVAVTTHAPIHEHTPWGHASRHITEFLLPFVQIAKYTKMKFVPAFAVHGAEEITEEELRQKSKEYVTMLQQPFERKKN